MMSFSFFLARRFMRASSHERSLSVMIIICFTGIFISTLALALSAAIMKGLERATHEKLQGVHADLMIRAYTPLNAPQIEKILKAEFSTEIIAASARRFGHGILVNENEHDMTCPVLIVGVNPGDEQLLNGVSQMIIGPTETALDKLLGDNEIVMGQAKLQELNKNRGESTTIFFAAEKQKSKNKLLLGQENAIISGIFKTGLEEIDDRVILMNNSFFDELFPNIGVTEIALKIAQDVDPDVLKRKLEERFNLAVFSWHDLYPGLTSAMLLERFVALFIMGLIGLIASMNIISLLFMYITNKRSDIAILKAMGASNRAIESAFIFLGLLVTFLAMLAGLVSAWLISFLLEQYKLIELPDIYYTTHVPADMNFTILIGVACLVLFMGLCASWIPTRRIRAISIANVLKFEV